MTNVDNINLWECKVHVLILKPLSDKLESKIWESKFM
jgi:hypothetical protein